MFTRDPWFGLRSRPRFDEFRRWWHREKARAGLGDLTTRREAEDTYADWASSHPPKERS
jgi:hypothetical protein